MYRLQWSWDPKKYVYTSHTKTQNLSTISFVFMSRLHVPAVNMYRSHHVKWDHVYGQKNGTQSPHKEYNSDTMSLYTSKMEMSLNDNSIGTCIYVHR